MNKGQQWRKLNGAEKEKLIGDLSNIGRNTVEVAWVPADPEAEAFARQLADVFEKAKWAFNRPVHPYTLDLTGAPAPLGLQMYCKCTLQSLPPVVEVIVSTMKRAEIAISRHIGNAVELSLDSQSIAIVIGHKPQDASGSDFLH